MNPDPFNLYLFMCLFIYLFIYLFSPNQEHKNANKTTSKVTLLVMFLQFNPRQSVYTQNKIGNGAGVSEDVITG